MELTKVIDGHTVFVDVSGLAGVEQVGLCVPIVVVAVVVAGLVGKSARADRRPFLLGAILTGTVGAALALLSAPVVVGRLASWMPGLSERIGAGSAVVALAGFACGALVCLVPLAFFTVERRVAVAIAVVGAVAFGAGVTGISRAQEKRRVFVRALQQAWPVPQLVFPGQEPGGVLPDVQVGRTRDLAPVTWWQLGLRQPVLFGVLGESAVAFPASDVANWNLSETRAVLAADAPGIATTTAEARQGPVRVTAPVRFRAVADTAPAHFPLTLGARLAFARVSGAPGVTGELAVTKQKKLREDVVVDVVSERVEDGFRVVTVHVSDGSMGRTEDVVAKDGQLYRKAGGDVFVGASCGLSFLEQPACVCDDRGVARCAHVESDTLGAFVRVGLLIATLGVSEVMGACDGCGEGREHGLIRLP